MTEGKSVTERSPRVAVALPLGQVASLEMARRICPERTIRSTCYAEKLASLGAVDRARVNLMETRLYESAPRASACKQGKLHLPDSRFDSLEGSIWFHYSPALRKFVLGYFELKRQDGASGSGGTFGDTRDYGRRMVCGWKGGIAAHLARLLSSKRKDAFDLDVVAFAVPSLGEQGQDDSISDFGLLTYPPTRGKLLIDIAESCRSLSSTGSMMLPGWSLLGRTAIVQEQVENRFARAIFAGEALCQLSETIGGAGSSGLILGWHSLDRRSRGASCSKRAASQILTESVAILSAIREGDPNCVVQREIHHFATASLMDGEMLADVRRLALIRSEMTFYLATAVARPAHSDWTDSYVAAREQLQRYALLSEFVGLSSAYFGDCDDGLADEDLMQALPQQARDKAEAFCEMMHDLEDFGCSTSLIVDELAPSDFEEGPHDFAAMHERLLGIATEILKPSTRVR
ncbi:MAG: hypothetical protein WBR13_01825 [Allosphingosinicella sp.]